jgi:hypothetical protein
MSEPNPFDIEALARRLAGISLDYRRFGTDWPQPWRARMVANKNERDYFRLVAYGETAQEALANLDAAVTHQATAHTFTVAPLPTGKMVEYDCRDTEGFDVLEPKDEQG